MMVLNIPVEYEHEVTVGGDDWDAAQEWAFRNVNECYYTTKKDKQNRLRIVYNFKSAQDATLFRLKFA